MDYPTRFIVNMPPTRKTIDRHSSGRSARNSVVRPANYYARHDATEPPPGFFPAVQHFTDSIAAVPKEVMRHMTLLKEVEAKLYGPTQALSRLVDTIDAMPFSRRARQPSRQDLLCYTANNSAAGSIDGSVSMPDAPTAEEYDMPRRQEFHNLRMVITGILGNMDEKNVCLAEANRTLDRQLERVKAVLPHVESEISEEARLGSLNHWAYADKKPEVESARRNVAATNSLAAAAASVHESDIAAARASSKKIEVKRPEVKKPEAKKPEIKKPEVKNSTTVVRKPQPPSVKRRKVESAPMERTASGKMIKPVKAPEVKKRKPALVPLAAVKKRLQSPAQSPSPVDERRPSSARAKRKSPSPTKDRSRKNSVHEERGRDYDASGHDRSRSRQFLKQIASFNRSPVLGKDDLGRPRQDNDDNNEPEKSYCYCGGMSYGVMIGCENESCEREWFHLECCGLKDPPPDTGMFCKPVIYIWRREQADLYAQSNGFVMIATRSRSGGAIDRQVFGSWSWVSEPNYALHLAI